MKAPEMSVRTQLKTNGDNSVTLHLRPRDVIVIIGTVVTVVSALAVGLAWARRVTDSCDLVDRLNKNFRTLEVVVSADQASTRVLTEAILRKVVNPAEADVIIEQANKTREEMIKALEKQSE